MQRESGLEGEGLVVVDAGQTSSVDALRELPKYSELLRFLIWRGVKVRYAQTSIGIGWAVFEPLVQVLVYTVIFGVLIGVPSEGRPYFLFVFVALVPWTFFGGALNQATGSLTENANLLSKVYFPRLILPLASIGRQTVDFLIAFGILVLLLIAYGIVPGPGVLMLPVLFLIAAIAALGGGLWLSALAIQYRDVRHAAGFLIQLMKYAVPIVYAIDVIPSKWHWAYAMNPMVGVVEGFRAALFADKAMPYDLIGIGAAVSLLLLVTGFRYFNRREHMFADVG